MSNKLHAVVKRSGASDVVGGLCASVSGVPAVAVCGGFAREVFFMNRLD